MQERIARGPSRRSVGAAGGTCFSLIDRTYAPSAPLRSSCSGIMTMRSWSAPTRRKVKTSMIHLHTTREAVSARAGE